MSEYDPEKWAVELCSLLDAIEQAANAEDLEAVR